MPPEPMRRFPVPDRGELPEDIRNHIEAETDRSGFTPNYLAAMSYKPGQYRAFFDYYETIVHESPLAREELEILTVTVSGENDCPYCVVAHGALLRIYGEDRFLAEQLMMNYRTADISDTHKAMCDLAVKLTKRPAEVSEADIQRLREYGFSNEEIWDIGAITALFNLSNRMVHLADMRPNEEFYEMGRNARNEVVEDFRDPYLAVDSEGCLVDFNSASQQLVDAIDEEAVGEPLEDVFPEFTEQVDKFETEQSIDTEIRLHDGSRYSYYDVSIAPRTGRPANEQLGRLIVFREITTLKEREEAQDFREEAKELLAELEETLAVGDGEIIEQ